VTAEVTDQGERRRRDILLFIAEFWAANGYAPTVREVASGTGLRTPSAAYYHLVLLEQAGHLQWKTAIARSLRVVPPC